MQNSELKLFLFLGFSYSTYPNQLIEDIEQNITEENLTDWRQVREDV